MQHKNEILLNQKFKAMSDKTRREILCFLKDGEKSAGEIAAQFSITGPSISYHLNILVESKLIAAHKYKRSILYELNVLEFNQIIKWLDRKEFRKCEENDFGRQETT